MNELSTDLESNLNNYNQASDFFKNHSDKFINLEITTLMCIYKKFVSAAKTQAFNDLNQNNSYLKNEISFIEMCIKEKISERNSIEIIKATKTTAYATIFAAIVSFLSAIAAIASAYAAFHSKCC